jgi:hypothetical protein
MRTFIRTCLQVNTNHHLTSPSLHQPSAHVISMFVKQCYVPTDAFCDHGSLLDHVSRTRKAQYNRQQSRTGQEITMATNTFACDLIETITQGRDTARSSQSLASTRSTDSSSEAAPAPTRFVRKQKKDCAKSFVNRAGSLTSHRPVIEDVGGDTCEFASSANAKSLTSKYYVAHRQYVAELLVSPDPLLEKCLEMWDEHMEALQPLNFSK